MIFFFPPFLGLILQCGLDGRLFFPSFNLFSSFCSYEAKVPRKNLWAYLHSHPEKKDRKATAYFENSFNSKILFSIDVEGQINILLIKDSVQDGIMTKWFGESETG